MSKTHMIAYVIISGVTPALVLLNNLQGTAAFSTTTAAQSLQSISWLERIMNSGLEDSIFMSETTDTRSRARIGEQNSQS
ncbi:MAG: hypothetical protein AAFW75_23035 [Cyanobacteria bacterium J06636_16]